MDKNNWVNSPYAGKEFLTLPSDVYDTQRRESSKSGDYSKLVLDQIARVARDRFVDPRTAQALAIKETTAGKGVEAPEVYRGPEYNYNLRKRMGLWPGVEQTWTPEKYTADDVAYAAKETAASQAAQRLNSLNEELLTPQQRLALMDRYKAEELQKFKPQIKNTANYAHRTDSINAGLDVMLAKQKEAFQKGWSPTTGLTMNQGRGIDPVTKANNRTTDAYGKHIQAIRQALIQQLGGR